MSSWALPLAAAGELPESFFKERTSDTLPCQATDKLFCFDWARDNIDRYGTPTVQHLKLVAFSHGLQEVERAIRTEDSVMARLCTGHRLRRCTGLAQVEQVERVVALVRSKVRIGNGEHGPFAVGRNFRSSEAVHHVHVGRGHRTGGSG